MMQSRDAYLRNYSLPYFTRWICHFITQEKISATLVWVLRNNAFLVFSLMSTFTERREQGTLMQWIKNWLRIHLKKLKSLLWIYSSSFFVQIIVYYERMLSVHNFTLYDLTSKDGHCSLWHEGEGNLDADEFASIVIILCHCLTAVRPSSSGLMDAHIRTEIRHWHRQLIRCSSAYSQPIIHKHCMPTVCRHVLAVSRQSVCRQRVRHVNNSYEL